MNTAHEFCRKTIADEAHDLYLISLMAKPRFQPHLWALFAFAHELAKTRLVVIEPTLGLIRLQWWRDELDKIYAAQPHAASEVLVALRQAIDASGLDKQDLLNLIDARDDEFRTDDAPKSPQEIQDHLKLQNAPLIKMAAQICDENVSLDTIETIAQNRGIINVLYRAKEGSIVAKNKQFFQDAFTLKVKTKSRIVRAFQSHNSIHFKRLKATGFDVTAQCLKKPPAFEVLRLWLS